jgi:hypothetical protein
MDMHTPGGGAVITQVGREPVDDVWPGPFTPNAADWNDIPRPGLPHDFTDWEVTVVVLALIVLTGLILFAVAELHETASQPGSPSGVVRAEARPKIAQEAHIAELVKEHRRAVIDSPALLR